MILAAYYFECFNPIVRNMALDFFNCSKKENALLAPSDYSNNIASEFVAYSKAVNIEQTGNSDFSYRKLKDKFITKMPGYINNVITDKINDQLNTILPECLQNPDLFTKKDHPRYPRKDAYYLDMGDFTCNLKDEFERFGLVPTKLCETTRF